MLSNIAFITLPKITGGLLGVSLLANIASLPALAKLLEIGALGLCALMVFMSYKERKETAVERKEERSSLVTELQERTDAFTKAVNRISEALEDRPCVKNDKRIEKPSG